MTALAAGTFVGLAEPPSAAELARRLGRKRLVVAVALGAVYTVGAQLPFWFVDAPEAGVAFFPAAGVTFALLALTPKRTWPLWLGTVAACEVAVDLGHGQGLGMALGFALANTVEPALGATLLRRRLPSHTADPRRQLRDYLGFGVAAGPIAGALVATITVALVDGGTDGLVGVAGRWWLGDAMGVLVVATPLLAWYRRNRFDAQAPWTETAAMVGLVVGLVVVPAIVWHHPLLYVVTPILLWAAIRGGMRALGASGLGLVFAADWAAVTGRMTNLVATGAFDEQLVLLQVALGLTLVLSMFVTVEVAERRRIEHTAQRADAERLRSEVRAMEVAQAERAVVARETHDIVGHGLNVMLLQAGAARRVLDTDPEMAAVLLESIERVGKDAFEDLDRALAAAWDGDPRTRRGVASVPALVGALREGGLDIDVAITGEARELPPVVDWAAYRIVQEALTNVSKHAPLAHADVTVAYAPDALRVSVIDDGHGSPAAPIDRLDGFGVAGMRKRVTTLSGQLVAAPRPEGGFRVEATIPAA